MIKFTDIGFIWYNTSTLVILNCIHVRSCNHRHQITGYFHLPQKLSFCKSTPYSGPLAPMDMCSVPTALFFPECNINIKQHPQPPESDFFHLALILLRFIHCFACIFYCWVSLFYEYNAISLPPKYSLQLTIEGNAIIFLLLERKLWIHEVTPLPEIQDWTYLIGAGPGTHSHACLTPKHRESPHLRDLKRKIKKEWLQV